LLFCLTCFVRAEDSYQLSVISYRPTKIKNSGQREEKKSQKGKTQDAKVADRRNTRNSYKEEAPGVLVLKTEKGRHTR
jgi:hypothetical protein